MFENAEDDEEFCMNLKDVKSDKEKLTHVVENERRQRFQYDCVGTRAKYPMSKRLFILSFYSVWTLLFTLVLVAPTVTSRSSNSMYTVTSSVSHTLDGTSLSISRLI